MDIDQARTFLTIAANGSFVEAAKRLHLTQSTVSARIQRLEQELDARLFVRNRAGASLTQAGRRFMEYAKRLILTAEQARQEIGLPSRYRSNLRVGGRIALWERFLPQFVGEMREAARDIAIASEIGFESDLMRHLIEGSLDLGLMYSPTHSSGLVVEHLFDESLILVSTDPAAKGPGEDYIYVEWGPGFSIQHTKSYPDLERPPQTVNIGWLGVQLLLNNGGSCFLPQRMASPFIKNGVFHKLANSPEYVHPAYMVYPRNSDNPVLEQALALLRQLALRHS